MKLFLDTANLEQIQDAISKGVIQGVTTNPSLLAKEPKTDFYLHIEKIIELCRGADLPLSVEVFAEDPDEMISQGKEMVERFNYSNLNIKIPVGPNELRVIHELSRDNIKVNCTCCFSATQMQLAAFSGAKYVSLFYNRLFDAGGDPLKILQRVRKFIDTNGFNCEIIAGSIRNAYDLEDCWDAGAHIVTAGYGAVIKGTQHPKTTESINGFLNDFKDWIK
jgi:transaldolase